MFLLPKDALLWLLSSDALFPTNPEKLGATGEELTGDECPSAPRPSTPLRLVSGFIRSL